MRFEWLEVRDFRNHQQTRLEAAVGATVLVGNNGEGKTNLAEAVSYVCLTKSFYADSDGHVVRQGSKGFSLEAELRSDSDIRFRVWVGYEHNTGTKALTVNGAPIGKMSEQIGQFPVVVLSPEQSGITTGTPAERRQFMDLVISQSSRLYLEDLLKYRRVLRQRNKVLLDAKLSQGNCRADLAPWNESLAETGSRLMHKRTEFVGEFRPYLVESYRQVAGPSEQLGTEYEANVRCETGEVPDAIRARIMEALKEREQDEQRLGTSLAGPHRDELRLELGGFEARKFASQGQHKTLLIAMKLAELRFLRERSKETPILVLDDVLSELDGHRTTRLLELLPEFGQTFVTVTTDRAFPTGFYESGENRRVVIKAGTILHEEQATTIS
jgi:DNA replication and repair protein RecF